MSLVLSLIILSICIVGLCDGEHGFDEIISNYKNDKTWEYLKQEYVSETTPDKIGKTLEAYIEKNCKKPDDFLKFIIEYKHCLENRMFKYAYLLTSYCYEALCKGIEQKFVLDILSNGFDKLIRKFFELGIYSIIFPIIQENYEMIAYSTNEDVFLKHLRMAMELYGHNVQLNLVKGNGENMNEMFNEFPKSHGKDYKLIHLKHACGNSKIEDIKSDLEKIQTLIDEFTLNKTVAD